MAGGVYHRSRGATSSRRNGFAGLVAMLMAVCWAGAATAQSPDSTYWGPAPADSAAVVFRQPGLPPWEAAVVYPWRVVTYPIKLAGLGIGALVVAGDRGHVIDDIVDLITPPPRIIGLTPTLNAGGLNGFGGGLTFYDNAFLGADNRARIGGDLTTNGSQRYRMGVLLNEPGKTSVEVGAGYRLRRNARFFGVGPHSDADDESYYGLETSWGGLGINRQVAGDWAIHANILATTAGTRRSAEEDDEELDQVFAGRLPFGYNARSDGGALGLDVTTGEPRTHVRPDDEALLRFHIAYFDDWNGSSPSYWSGRVTARRYFPLWYEQRTLMLRGVVAWADPVGHGEMPFQRMNSNHGLDRMRGYQDFRFTDNGLAMLSAEYRWPIWVTKEATNPGLDFLLLGDAGQVFREADQLALKDLALSYGFGLEYAGARGLLARVEFGWSEEDRVIRFSLVNLLETGTGQIYLGRALDREP
jgi:hypothetical protein